MQEMSDNDFNIYKAKLSELESLAQEYKEKIQEEEKIISELKELKESMKEFMGSFYSEISKYRKD